MAEIRDPLGRWVDRSDRVLRPVEDLMNFVAASAIMFLMFLGVVQIVLRAKWLFNAPIFGYIDLIELVMPALAILGFAYCQREGVHIRMDILIRRCDLAEYLGMQPETVSRCFRELEDNRIIRIAGRSKIFIQNAPVLRRIANGQRIDKRLDQPDRTDLKIIQIGRAHV